MKEVLEYMAKAIVDEPDAVEVTEVSGERSLILQLRVAPDDMGKVIGKRGRTVRAIRSLVRAAGSRQGVTTLVEIVEGGSGEDPVEGSGGSDERSEE